MNDLVERLVDAAVDREHAQTAYRRGAQIELDEARAALVAEIDRLRTALHAVRASTDPQWTKQLIDQALQETTP